MEKYNIVMRVIHFIMALMIIVLLSVGVIMTEMPDGDSKWQIYFMHKSFGALALLLVCLRMVVRFKSTVPELPEQISSAEVKAAKWGHYSLYAFMFIVPLTGVLMSVFSGRGVAFFTTTFFTDFDKNELIASVAREMHEVLPYILMTIIGFHVLGAFKHLLVDKINIFRRIFW